MLRIVVPLNITIQLNEYSICFQCLQSYMSVDHFINIATSTSEHINRIDQQQNVAHARLLHRDRHRNRSTLQDIQRYILTPSIQLDTLIFSFCECAMSSPAPIGSNSTLHPLASCSVMVTGIEPPSRVMSGSICAIRHKTSLRSIEVIGQLGQLTPCRWCIALLRYGGPSSMGVVTSTPIAQKLIKAQCAFVYLFKFNCLAGRLAKVCAKTPILSSQYLSQ